MLSPGTLSKDCSSLAMLTTEVLLAEPFGTKSKGVINSFAADVPKMILPILKINSNEVLDKMILQNYNFQYKL